MDPRYAMLSRLVRLRRKVTRRELSSGFKRDHESWSLKEEADARRVLRLVRRQALTIISADDVDAEDEEAIFMELLKRYLLKSRVGKYDAEPDVRDPLEVRTVPFDIIEARSRFHSLYCMYSSIVHWSVAGQDGNGLALSYPRRPSASLLWA